MKRLVTGILAHVDAGKTTLSEGLMYLSGGIRTLGRVDHQNAFLDNFALERERGITIFSKQAVISFEDIELILLDTPGHVDFSSEMERVLQVLDYAVLVINATDGIQGHTRTLWRLLSTYNIPTFLFINKMDLRETDPDDVIQEIKRDFGDGCIGFSSGDYMEAAAMCSEESLEEYLETGKLSDEKIETLILERKVFPCFFGSALKLEGVQEFLTGFKKCTREPVYGQELSGKVFKIARDSSGIRLTYMKITGGSLKVRETIGEEKITEIRIYSGAKYKTVNEVSAGEVCAVTGLSSSFPGQGIGAQGEGIVPVLQPVMTYKAILPEGLDPLTALGYFRQLEDEDPQLHIVWHEHAKELHLQLMGQVQLEILEKTISERFGSDIAFDTGSVIYMETLAKPNVGMGHFEPLRHYAEVQLLLEPAERGSGLHFYSDCSLDILDGNWQNLILTHLAETDHPGVLTGNPITDLNITLLTGRGHLKHTEGGDFRQATYRAVQHGLKTGENILLEPWYEYKLEVPSESAGKALGDIQKFGGEFEPPETVENTTVISGKAPVSLIGGYAREVAAYTCGEGRISFMPAGYMPCHNTDEVVEEIGYNSENNPDFTADSVFCSHGSGFVVKWNEAKEHMHLAPVLDLSEDEPVPEEAPAKQRTSTHVSNTFAGDKELMAIFEQAYGPVKYRQMRPAKASAELADHVDVPLPRAVKEYLLVDGYNVIFAWDELKKLAADSIDAARKRLMDMLCNYRSFHSGKVILVFDAYKVIGGEERKERYNNITIVYTRQAETADTYIERASFMLSKDNRVRVVTSDYNEQLIILGHGALRVSASMFHDEMLQVQKEMQEIMDGQNRMLPSRGIEKAYNEAVENSK